MRSNTVSTTSAESLTNPRSYNTATTFPAAGTPTATPRASGIAPGSPNSGTPPVNSRTTDVTAAPIAYSSLANARATLAAAEARLASAQTANLGDVSNPHNLLPLPGHLSTILPNGGLTRGNVIICPSDSLLVSLLAALTAAGNTAAVLGHPHLGLLAAAERGADLTRLFHIPHPGPDPFATLSILVEGLDLVVFALPTQKIPPRRTQTLKARLRFHHSILIATTPLPGADLHLTAHPTSYQGITRGHGHLQTISHTIHTHAKNHPPLHTQQPA